MPPTASITSPSPSFAAFDSNILKSPGLLFMALHQLRWTARITNGDTLSAACRLLQLQSPDRWHSAINRTPSIQGVQIPRNQQINPREFCALRLSATK